MKGQYLLYQLGLLLVCLTGVGTLHAQLPAPAQDALDRGVIAAKLPDYPLAIKYFEEARKIAPDAPVVYFNLGLAESKIPGRELRAICWLAAYLSAEPNAANRAAVLEEIKLLEVKNQSNFQRVIGAMEIGAKSIAGSDKYDFWPDITRTWMQSGDLTDAIKAAEKSKDTPKAELVQALIEKGDLAQAEKVAATITDKTAEIAKVRVMIGYADDKIRTGNPKVAREILRTAVKSPDLIKLWEVLQNNAKIAVLQSKIGDQEGVKTTLEEIQRNYEKISGWEADSKINLFMKVAEAQTKAGDSAGSRETLITAHNLAETIPKVDKSNIYASDKKSESFNKIAVQEAQNGDFALALKTTESITDEYYKYLALNEIAKSQANSGDFVQAKKTIDLITGFPKSTGLTLVAREQANAGDRSGTLETLNLILSDKALIERIKQKKPEINEGNVKMLTEVADVQALAGDIPAARKTLAIAQQLCDRITNNKGYITEDNSNRKAAQYNINRIVGKIGRTDSPASVWIVYLEDSNTYDDAPLNLPMFLDLTEHLKSLPQSNDPEVVFKSLRDTADRMARAQTTILGLLKEQFK
jgi:tetratricopeptide (TPR) repeat protein